uniref:CUB domain-containing protein n=1 Tax=Panagrellus redivivus TaxID=6233 RepID=A0A7E4USE5_PANRE
MSFLSLAASHDNVFDYAAYCNNARDSSKHGVVGKDAVSSDFDIFDALGSNFLLDLNDYVGDAASVYAFEDNDHDSCKNDNAINYNNAYDSSTHGVVGKDAVSSDTDDSYDLFLLDLINYVGQIDDVESVYAFEGTAYDSYENDEVESVYAFDYNKPDTDDKESVYAFESMNDFSEASSDTDDDSTESDVVDHVEEVVTAPTQKTETWMEFLYFACISQAPLFIAKYLLVYYAEDSPLCFVIALFLLFSYFYNLMNRYGLNGYERLLREHDTSLQCENLSGLTTDEAEIKTTEAGEETDEVCSVYAYDALNDESAGTTEGDYPFGFAIRNCGTTYIGRHAFVDDFDYSIQFVDETVTELWNKTTDELLTLVFDGPNLKVVKRRCEEYTSFATLPTEIADALVTARVTFKKL